MHPVVHISALRECLTSGAFPDREERYTPPPPEIIAEEEYFRIAAFVGERGKGASKSYLVHWEGYGPEHRQWLTKSRLLQDMSQADFDEFLSAYESSKSNQVRLTKTTRPRRRR